MFFKEYNEEISEESWRFVCSHEFTARVKVHLHGCLICSLEELSKIPRNFMMKNWRNFGKVSIKNIERILNKNGFELKDEDEYIVSKFNNMINFQKTNLKEFITWPREFRSLSKFPRKIYQHD